MRGFSKFLLIVGTLLVAAFGALLWFIESNTPKRNRYVIPEGYAGWLCVTYSVPGKPPLPTEDGFRLVAFDQTGQVQTSDEGVPGKLKDEFFISSSTGRRPMNIEREMGGGFTTSNPPLDSKRYTFMFWVSPDAKEEQLKYSSGIEHQCGPDTAMNK